MENDLIKHFLDIYSESNKLKCSICKHFLSIPPVVYVEEIGVVCGRCNHSIYEMKSNPKVDRQIIYEEIAACMVFPCKYQLHGCNEKLKWGNVYQHEESCVLGKIDCFYNFKEFPDDVEICSWSGNVNQITSHIKNKHYEYFVSPPKVNLQENRKRELVITEYLNQVMLFVFHFEEETESIFCLAVTDSKTLKIQYQLKILDADGETSISLPKRSLYGLPYIGSDVKRFGYKIHMSYIRLLPKAEYILIDLEAPKSTSTNKLNHISTEQREKILSIEKPKCDNCEKYIFPPAFLCGCTQFHKYCGACNIGSCPRQFACSRNLVLESLSLFTPYPCNNLSKGCSYIGSFPDIYTHQRICALNLRKCFFTNCGFRGKKHEIDFHMNKSHTFSDLDKYYPLIAQELLFTLDGQLLLLCVVVKSYDGNTLEFTVQFDEIEKTGYKYEIEIVSDEMIATKLLFQYVAIKDCGPVRIPLYLLRQLFPNIQTVKFKLKILKLPVW